MVSNLMVVDEPIRATKGSEPTMDVDSIDSNAGSLKKDQLLYPGREGRGLRWT